MTMPILPGHRRRAADEQVARQLRRRDRAARGDVRQADERPRRGDADYYELLLGERAAGAAPPIEAKRALARRIVERFHGADAAAAAEAHFDRVHVRARGPRRHRRASTCEPPDADDGEVHLPALIAERLRHHRAARRAG